MPAWPLLLTVLALSSGGTPVDEHKGVTFTVPKGWQTSESGEAKVLLPSDLKEGELAFVVITPAAKVEGDARKMFDKAVEETNKEAKILEKGKVEVQTANGITAYVQPFQAEEEGIGKHRRIVSMMVQHGQMTLVVIIVNTDAALEKYSDAISSILASIQLKGKEVPPADSGGTLTGGQTKLPRGETPGLFPGMPGWLPSGRGIKIPPAKIVNGKPQGIWWTPYSSTVFEASPTIVLYMPDGVRAKGPRLGAGDLFDLEGQRATAGDNGIGSFTIADGKITEVGYGRFTNDFKTGKDADSEYFTISSGKWRPVVPVTSQTIAGKWRSQGAQVVFHPDGTFEMGALQSDGDWAVGARTAGKYYFEGYLLMFAPEGRPSYIVTAGRSGPFFLTNSSVYFRVD